MVSIRRFPWIAIPWHNARHFISDLALVCRCCAGSPMASPAPSPGGSPRWAVPGRVDASIADPEEKVLASLSLPPPLLPPPPLLLPPTFFRWRTCEPLIFVVATSFFYIPQSGKDSDPQGPRARSWKDGIIVMNPRKRLSPCGLSLVRLALGPQPNGTREGQPAKFTLYSLTPSR